jgi:hypothetical protein
VQSKRFETLGQAWQIYAPMSLGGDDPLALPHLEMAFYAGAATVYSIMAAAITGQRDQSKMAIEKLQAELAAHAEKVRAHPIFQATPIQQ